MASRQQLVENALRSSRKSAYDLAVKKGQSETRKLMEVAATELAARLVQVESTGAGEGSFTATQMRATLVQLTSVLQGLNGDLKDLLLEQGKLAAKQAIKHQLAYLFAADKAFKGVGVQSLAIDEASMFDRTIRGVEASILRRIASGPEDTPEKLGILQRYGLETVGHFEDVLQQGMLQKTPWAEVRANLIAKSPFLQDAPLHWAERIVRSESMRAYNAAGFESLRAVQSELGDMVKILSATFDDRTGADSYAVHGQIRRPQEAFSDWYHNYSHPPNRPNDREIVVPHRLSWTLPGYLEWRTDSEVSARWRRDGRKGSPPARPLMTTVDMSAFTKEAKK